MPELGTSSWVAAACFWHVIHHQGKLLIYTTKKAIWQFFEITQSYFLKMPFPASASSCCIIIYMHNFNILYWNDYSEIKTNLVFSLFSTARGVINALICSGRLLRRSAKFFRTPMAVKSEVQFWRRCDLNSGNACCKTCSQVKCNKVQCNANFSAEKSIYTKKF